MIRTEFSEKKQMYENDTALIEKIVSDVAAFLKDESSGHDWEHIRRVWTNAKKIGAEEGADMLRVELAALLHDVDDWKVTGVRPGESDLVNARGFLNRAGAQARLIEDVCRIINAIDYRGSVTRTKARTTEDKVVHDADKLDAIGAIGIARCFAFGGKAGRPIFLPEIPPCPEVDEKRYADIHRRENTGVNHFFDKLLRLKDRMHTSTGAALAQERHETMVRFLRMFFREQGLAEWESRLDDFLREIDDTSPKNRKAP